MKFLYVVMITCFCFAVLGQSNRKARMAPIFAPGYYINNKNDTIRGQVQINPSDPTEFYRQFAFISGRSKKPKVIRAGQTKAYGFDGKHFVALETEGQKLFVERLTFGRLRFYEYTYNTNIKGQQSFESIHFIKDILAEGKYSDLKEPRKISHKFYKKSLKPYMRDQPMIWSDLDKYTFSREKVIQAITEFNQYYRTN